MFTTTLTSIIILPIISLSSLTANLARKEVVLGSHTMSLETRYADKYVNDIFKDNILLNTYYLGGKQISNGQPNWNEVRQPFEYDLKLQPGQVFAYHDDVLPEFQGKITRTTNAHFNSIEGFKSDGYLIGDGVCHLASLINWAAKDAGLEVKAPTNHDFAVIPEVPREYGVAIYALKGSPGTGSNQNLYVTNSKTKPVDLKFAYDGHNLTVSIAEKL